MQHRKRLKRKKIRSTQEINEERGYWWSMTYYCHVYEWLYAGVLNGNRISWTLLAAPPLLPWDGGCISLWFHCCVLSAPLVDSGVQVLNITQEKSASQKQQNS
jgi:hypothetical protein